MARTIANVLEDKKGEDILLLDIRELTDFTDYFVICSGTSDRMLKALADEVLERVRTMHGMKGRVEGLPQDGWLLIDYVDVVVHLFSPDRRDYYRLEELWGKGKVLLRLQ
ncbi:MAG: ribosome silencing factor [Chloroflexi bacterium RBG_16_57_11]|nr:MAG: ribosome silencing factor [Chloroflexi bacterium RBG_16_57_11]